MLRDVGRTLRQPRNVNYDSYTNLINTTVKLQSDVILMHFRDSSPHPICNSGDDAWQWPVFLLCCFFALTTTLYDAPTLHWSAACHTGSAGQNKQHLVTKNTAKLDRETEELHHDRVPLEVGKVIQQGRQEKGLTQKDLATVSIKTFHILMCTMYNMEKMFVFFSGCVYHCLPWLCMWLYLTFACINWCAEGQKHGIKLITTYRSVTINMLPTHQYMCMNLIISASLDIWLLC